MVKLDKTSRVRLSLVTVGIALSFVPQVGAHTIKTGGDVAVTFHIEPDHNPKAGDTSRAWFAMTRRGGMLVSFSECHCKLGVYLDSSSEDLTQIMSTSLKPVSAEQNKNIPAADLVFPKAGLYRLEFSGTPKQEGAFKPFRLTYNVTVLPGNPVSSSPAPSTDNAANPKSPQSDEKASLTPILSLLAGLGFGGAIAFNLYQQRRKKPTTDTDKTWKKLLHKCRSFYLPNI